jgi:septum formation protein
MMPMPQLILASASPRRAELLTAAGFTFNIAPSPVDEPEDRPADIAIQDWPATLARHKAKAVQRSGIHSPNAIILGADTIVVLGDTIINKASDRAHAAALLQSLAGKTHDVITGIALLRGSTCITATATARVHIRERPPAAWQTYLDSNLWRGKAGAYGIQDDNADWTTLLDGDIETVIGLPTQLVRRTLMQLEATV